MNRIALVSMNNSLQDNLKNYLSKENYLVCSILPDQLDECSGNIIIIDFMTYPEFLSTNIKKDFFLKTVPVIGILDDMLISKISSDFGIDDFVFNGFNSAELKLRIKFLLWKHYGISSDEVIQIGSLIINTAQHKVLVNLEKIDLTYMEFKLLQFLATNKNRVFSRNHILERVWGFDYYGGTRTVDVHVRRLRSKLGLECGRHIDTVRNVGYKFIDI